MVISTGCSTIACNACQARRSGSSANAGRLANKKYYVSNLPSDTSLKILAATIKARWICEQAHQQLKEELGLDHFEGRSWTGLHRHALMTMIAYAFLQARRLKAAGRKKESAAHRHNRACQRLDKPFSTSSHGRHPADARTVRSCWHTPENLNCQSSARCADFLPRTPLFTRTCKAA